MTNDKNNINKLFEELNFDKNAKIDFNCLFHKDFENTFKKVVNKVIDFNLEIEEKSDVAENE